MKGYRTIIIGLVLAIAPGALSYLAGVDWAALGISAPVATLIAGAIMIALRAVTTTGIGKAAIVLPLALAFGLGACTQLSNIATKVDPALETACNAAMTLAPLAGPYAPFIVAACGSAEAITKLAEDPASLAWLNGLIANTQGLIHARMRAQGGRG